MTRRKDTSADRPRSGGSFVRQKNGTLKRQTPAAAPTPMPMPTETSPPVDGEKKDS